MASLSVRQLDDSTVTALRVRAAEHGVSMEEEARRILRNAVVAPSRLGDLAVDLFSPYAGEKLALPARESSDEPLDFS